MAGGGGRNGGSLDFLGACHSTNVPLAVSFFGGRRFLGAMSLNKCVDFLLSSRKYSVHRLTTSGIATPRSWRSQPPLLWRPQRPSPSTASSMEPARRPSRGLRHHHMHVMPAPSRQIFMPWCPQGMFSRGKIGTAFTQVLYRIDPSWTRDRIGSCLCGGWVYSEKRSLMCLRIYQPDLQASPPPPSVSLVNTLKVGISDQGQCLNIIRPNIKLFHFIELHHNSITKVLPGPAFLRRVLFSCRRAFISIFPGVPTIIGRISH
ncbi:hypothetical protein C8J57DRAFT_445362 [Mycena rebaudengoi]|nr:hypothetical protein C8J57DRAFT_445362 [Mycena rebaudengoi]